MERKMHIAEAMIVAGLLLVHRGAEAIIELPFSAGESWYVCNGYNGYGFHKGAPVLDLSADPNSSSQNGCLPTEESANASSGREVRAPWKGVVSSFGRSDMICVTQEGDARSMAIGHLDSTTKLKVGTSIKAGDFLGIVSAPNTANGGYAHIHVQEHEGAGCTGNLIPFEADMRFVDVQDMPYRGDQESNQWSYRKTGKRLTRAAASAWHPAGTLIRAVDDDRVYYLQRDNVTGKLKRRHIVIKPLSPERR